MIERKTTAFNLYKSVYEGMQPRVDCKVCSGKGLLPIEGAKGPYRYKICTNCFN